jgi:hypothetical protein
MFERFGDYAAFQRFRIATFEHPCYRCPCFPMAMFFVLVTLLRLIEIHQNHIKKETKS